MKGPTIIFPEDLKSAVEEWKSGNYIQNNIQNGDDLFKSINHGDNFIIKYADHQPKGDLKMGICFLINDLVGSAFVIYIAIPSHLILLLILVVIWCFPGCYTFFRLLSNRRQEIMKNHGYIAINSRGVLYRYSPKKFGLFTWSSIVSIKEGGNIGFTHEGKYIHCQLKPQKRSLERRKYNHLIRYDNIDTTVIASIKLFYGLVKRYWKKYRDSSPPNSKIPTPYVSDNLLFILFSIGLLFIPAFSFIMILL